MRYLTAGAIVNGQRPLTKKAFKRAAENNPDSVRFDNMAPGFIATREFPTNTRELARYRELFGDDATLSVCGPDPYNDRRWYANVTATKTGKVTVK